MVPQCPVPARYGASADIIRENICSYCILSLTVASALASPIALCITAVSMIPSTITCATWIPLGPNSRASDCESALRANAAGAATENAGPPPAHCVGILAPGTGIHLVDRDEKGVYWTVGLTDAHGSAGEDKRAATVLEHEWDERLGKVPCGAPAILVLPQLERTFAHQDCFLEDNSVPPQFGPARTP